MTKKDLAALHAAQTLRLAANHLSDYLQATRGQGIPDREARLCAGCSAMLRRMLAAAAQLEGITEKGQA